MVAGRAIRVSKVKSTVSLPRHEDQTSSTVYYSCSPDREKEFRYSVSMPGLITRLLRNLPNAVRLYVLSGHLSRLNKIINLSVCERRRLIPPDANRSKTVKRFLIQEKICWKTRSDTRHVGYRLLKDKRT